jgi:hypothetical protein
LLEQQTTITAYRLPTKEDRKQAEKLPFPFSVCSKQTEVVSSVGSVSVFIKIY